MTIKVMKWLHVDNRIRNSGTCWTLWGGYVTADHVFLGADKNLPDFAQPPVMRGPNGLDICFFGCTLPPTRPREPVAGEEITVSGYPAGAGTLEHRYATVYMKRPTGTSWIGKIDQWHPPYPRGSTLFDAVYGGMSGGLVSATDGTPLGVLITQNGRAHLDRDDLVDDSFDFISLAQAWEALNDAPTFT